MKCSLEDLARGVTKTLKVRLPQQPQEELYVIRLKKGWKAGTKIKFSPRGSFPAMTFVVEDKPHPFLQRHGNDLNYNCEITAKQAKRGATIKIPLPDGEIFSLSTESHIPMETDYIMTVPDKGMPINGGPERGNLLIRFRIKDYSSWHAS